MGPRRPKCVLKDCTRASEYLESITERERYAYKGTQIQNGKAKLH